jgi:hypothetical protein
VPLLLSGVSHWESALAWAVSENVRCNPALGIHIKVHGWALEQHEGPMCSSPTVRATVQHTRLGHYARHTELLLPRESLAEGRDTQGLWPEMTLYASWMLRRAADASPRKQHGDQPDMAEELVPYLTLSNQEMRLSTILLL